VSEPADETTESEEGTPQVEGVPAEPVPIEPSEGDEEGAAEEEESHDGEQEPQPGEEPEQPQEEPQALSEREIEARLTKLNKEGERHAKRVVEVMGESMADLHVCELCWPFAPGFRFEPIPDQQRAAVMLLLGMSGVGNYVHDRHSDACGDCNGWGLVATGSKVAGQDALTCMNCGGKGWMGDRAATSVAAPVTVTMTEQDNGAPAPAPLSPDAQAAKAAAEAAGFIVIDTHAPAVA